MKEEEIKDLALKFQSGIIESSYQINKKLQQENKSLQSQLKAKEEVIKELKKWLEETEAYFEGQYKTAKSNLVYRYFRGAKNAIGDALLKMQELEILSKGESK